MSRTRRLVLALAVAATAVTGVTVAASGLTSPAGAPADDALPVASTEAAPPAETVPPPAPAPSEPPAATQHAAPAAPPPPRVRQVSEPGFMPFATVGPVTLVHPATRIERVGFHQSNHEGAQELTPLPTAVAGVTLESRGRETGLHTAVDVVLDPEGEVRAPVTGRVKRAGTYVLYCRHSDDYVVIEPEARPGWEVKVLHISGVQVSAGDRVVAGETVLAPRPTPLPFESQIDALRTGDTAWPHVHLEVVDPSIPNRPNRGGGGGCP